MKKIAIMNKKIKKLHLGFTVAELLLSMLVVMVIAAAMVPVIGPKKVKVPNLNKSHGIFEYYYDADGTLKQYHANNRGQKDAEPSTAEGGDHCVFHAPSADRYEIYAIGAGSSGYRNPERVGFTISPDATPLSGNISINNFTNDVVALSRLTNDAKGITEGSFANTVRAALDDWARQKKSQGSNLYLAFTNLSSPVDRGGKGISKIQVGDDIVLANGKRCSNLCNAGSCPGPYAPGTYWNTGNMLTGLSRARNNNKCFIYIHASGGDSTPGRAMQAGDTLLVPVDGLTASAAGFNVLFNGSSAKISTITRDGSAQIELRRKNNSSDNSIDARQDSSGALISGKNQNVSFPDLLSNGSRLMKLKKGGSISDLTALSQLTGSVYASGAPGGTTSGSGGTMAGGSARNGSASYVNNAFTWTYTKLKVRYEYGNAGKQGQVNVMSYSNLHGNIYCYPGVSDPEAGTALPTVVSKANDRREDSPGVIVSAESYATPGVPDVYESDLDAGKMPLPDSRIITLATANNDGLAPYIYKMRASGFRGGLYNCLEQHSCPGYAGSGAFPFLDLVEAQNTLTITDNQTAYSNGAPYTKPYDLRLTGSNGRCPSGATLTKPGSKYYVDAQGKHEYQEHYCIASEATRRDGAVVIIW